MVCQFTPARKLIPKSKAAVSSEFEYIGDRELDEKALCTTPEATLLSSFQDSTLLCRGHSCASSTQAHSGGSCVRISVRSCLQKRARAGDWRAQVSQMLAVSRLGGTHSCWGKVSAWSTPPVWGGRCACSGTVQATGVFLQHVRFYKLLCVQTSPIKPSLRDAKGSATGD